jgi:ComF family protein
MLLHRIARSLSGLLSPFRCAACDTLLHDDALFCVSCEDGGAPLVDRLDGDFVVVAAAPYRGSVARAITRMKYEGRPDLARALALRMLTALNDAGVRGPFALVPVPLHVVRLCSRGYNQSALLARRLATDLGYPFLPRALVRTRATREQASLARVERLENMAGAIQARTRVTGHVVLVDDVVTTGTTARACALALLEAGAATVTIAAAARAGTAASASTA